MGITIEEGFGVKETEDQAPVAKSKKGKKHPRGERRAHNRKRRVRKKTFRKTRQESGKGRTEQKYPPAEIAK